MAAKEVSMSHLLVLNQSLENKMKQIQANRLMALYNLLLDLPKKAIFDIGHWAEFDTPYQSEYVPATQQAAIDCGTSACAVGWGVLLIPSWQKDFVLSGNGSLHLRNEESFIGEPERKLTKFLGIDEAEFENLFMGAEYTIPEEDIKPRHVRTRIKRVLGKYGYDIV